MKQSISNDALTLLRRVNDLIRMFVPRLERPHLELISGKLIGYDNATRGYWIFLRASGKEYLIELDQK